MLVPSVNPIEPHEEFLTLQPMFSPILSKRFDMSDVFHPMITVCVCVFSSHSFWTSSSFDVPAGVTQEGGF